jgi:hypothetical protein
MPDREHHMKISAIMLALGLLLLASSLVLPSMSDGRHAWSQEKAERLQELGLNIHMLSSKVQSAQQGGGKVYGPKAKDPEEFLKDRETLRELQHEADNLESELNTVRESPQRWAAMLKWAGIILALAGVVFSVRRQS